jgi:hypothetical protein
VHIYKVTAFGAWMWAGTLSPGNSFKARTQDGVTWVVTNLRGNVITKVVGNSREGSIVLK